MPAISLPKSGGAIQGQGEKISVNAANGSAAVSIPLPLTSGRGGFTPKVTLAYDSGVGNGPFGFGWSLDSPAITRKTDKGLPRYRDAEESDVFILSGAEDLVPVLEADGTRQTLRRTVFGVEYDLFFYRPRIEGLFARIERWAPTSGAPSHWRSINREDVTTVYGYDAASRLADPADPARTFAWRISRSWTGTGHLVVYNYVVEDGAGIDTTAAHEVNRTAAIRGVQTYLKSIFYAADTPYLPDWTAEDEPALPQIWRVKAVLDYGDHGAVPPKPTPDQSWGLRPDAFSTCRPTFEVRTYRRVHRVLVFHDFPQEASAAPDLFVRSLDFVYSDEQAPADPLDPIYTFLSSATRTGYRQDGAVLVARSLPPLEFDYSSPVISAEILELDRDSLGNMPEGLDGQRYRWIDLDGEGLPGILAPTQGGWSYKRNLSAANLVTQPDGAQLARARFGPLEPVARRPNHDDLGGAQRFLDLGADGRQDLVALAEPDAGFYARTADYDFEPLKRFACLPNLDWSDPNLRFIDLTGDGLADVLLTEDGLFTYYESLGEAGFAIAQLVRTPWDEERGPTLVFADGTDTIFTADMTGDGLNDLVRIRNGEAAYWSNRGYGRFGPKVTMEGAPRFAAEELFDPKRIRLADIDGSGTTDILYVGPDGVRVWFNQSGNGWSAPSLVGVFPSTDQLSSVQVLDLLGTGTACLVWSSPLPGARAPLLYVDLMGGQKPHLLERVRNSLGAETRIAYAPSTRFYLADLAAGRPWVTRLPFPVQVVERHETIDWIGRSRLVCRYAYHHGYFDGFEREFRGFGMVEQRDTEDLEPGLAFNDTGIDFDQQSFSSPVMTRTWFHTGAFRQSGAVSRQYASEYWVEPALRPPARAADAAAMTLPDTVIPAGLDALEIQEAYRALKGHPLRVEVYAEDGTPQAADPYSVVESNFTIACLQRLGANRHAVFAVSPRENLTFHYERAADDPRVGHDLTLETDTYGNPLRTLSVGYPRRPGFASPEPALSATAQAMLAYDQTRLHVLGKEHLYTNAINDLVQWPDAYRAPTAAGANAAEITGVPPTAKGVGITDLFTFDEADTLWRSAWAGASDIPYEQIPASDVIGQGAPAAALTRRLVAQSRILFRRDDLTALLPQGQIEPSAQPGETYQAAFTQGQVDSIFGARLMAGDLAKGGYVQLDGEGDVWWTASGRLFLSPADTDTSAQELAEARAHFFLPRRSVDAFGGVSRIAYDAYDLLLGSTTDPVGNTTSTENDYRVLAAAIVTDPNTNRMAVAFDALGLVIANAVMGPDTIALGDTLTGFEADPDAASIAAFFADPIGLGAALIGGATTRLVYDLDAFQRTSNSAQPCAPAIASLARETHVSDLAKGQVSALQIAIDYSDGRGREIQRKARVADGPLVQDGPLVSPRWLGSGWTILDNKGRPVRQFEPFFTPTSAFEFGPAGSVATTLFYDPVGRGIASLNPDQTWTKTSFDAWRQQVWDANDTVLVADPRTDADVGGAFSRALGSGAFTSWHAAHTALGGDQKAAADKAAAHAGTPRTTHLDALGRACLAVDDCGGAQRFPIRTALDIQGQSLAVFDARGYRTEQTVLSSAAAPFVCGTDMAGRQIYQINADAGERRALPDITGHPFRAWDQRGHAFRTIYDAARRAVQRWLSTDEAPESLVDLTIWGEGQVAAANLAGRPFRHYDMAGVTENTAYDLAGNLTSSRRQLAIDWEAAPDWSLLVGQTDGAALDTAAQNAGLIPKDDGGRDSFVQRTVWDALKRPIQTVTPHSVLMQPDVLQPTYDAGAQLAGMDVWLQQAAGPATLLDPATADRHAVTDITYNPRGQRASIAFGNGVTSAHSYDPETFRLTRLVTTRPAGSADEQTVQDLSYVYDPVGNITHIQDNADIQNVIYFDNQRVEPSADYIYDPLYRLISAVGREHLGQTANLLHAPQQVNNDDSARMNPPQPRDGKAMGIYTETYGYDAAGNLLTMAHQVSSGSWTRRYAYQEASQILAGEIGNRLSATSLPGDPPAGPYTDKYAHNDHGSMTSMPHLPAMTWDEDERLRSTTRQVVKSGAPATTWYVYGADGQRVRKVSMGQAAAGQAPVRTVERIYLGGLEVWREYAADGTTIEVARETLHIDAGQLAALVETRTAGADDAPAQQVRYQYANQLGSAVLELGDDSSVVSYTEFFPYGATSYQAVAAQTDVPKRYGFTGKERDLENDLYYHGARYYAPWLGRWTACDPEGIRAGPNRFSYVSANPVRFQDPTGRWGEDVHFSLFYVAGRLAGASPKEAGQAAVWSQGMDDYRNLAAPGIKMRAVADSSEYFGVAGEIVLDAINIPKEEFEYLPRPFVAPEDIAEDARLSVRFANNAHALHVTRDQSEGVALEGADKHNIYMFGIGAHPAGDYLPHLNVYEAETYGHPNGWNENGSESSQNSTAADETSNNPGKARETFGTYTRLWGEFLGQSAPGLSEVQEGLLNQFINATDAGVKQDALHELLRSAGASEREIKRFDALQDAGARRSLFNRAAQTQEGQKALRSAVQDWGVHPNDDFSNSRSPGLERRRHYVNPATNPHFTP